MVMNNFPTARSGGLITQEAGKELLVYDTETHKTHHLNATSARVWNGCDGRTSTEEIAATTHVPIELVAVALADLEADGLLDSPSGHDFALDKVSRRRMLMQAAGIAAVLPLITSLVAPAAAQSQTGTCLGPCGAFDLNPTPFFNNSQACVDALIASAQTQCCSGVLNAGGGFVFGSNPELCRGFCGTITGDCVGAPA